MKKGKIVVKYKRPKTRRMWKINPRTRIHGYRKYRRSRDKQDFIKELKKEGI